MAYSELVKNFEKIRSYMREFYVYGFKSRTEYDTRSARSYDDERRRIASWLGEYMRFTQTADGKNVFLSVDSRAVHKNPFYRAWKAKSFTDGDITLHFAIFDVLYTPEIHMSLSELIEAIDQRLGSSMTFDESTLRKKLKEYVAEGIIQTSREGRRVFYRRSPDTDLNALGEVIDFFSETAPCGVIGSFLQDKLPAREPLFSFKHHYMTQAMDSDLLAMLFDAIQQKCSVTVKKLGKHETACKTLDLVPLKVYISVQNGRQNLIAYNKQAHHLSSYRLDYLSGLRLGSPYPEFDSLRAELRRIEEHMWGVNCRWSLKHLEHVEFEVQFGEDEMHIPRRLEREKRCGQVEWIDEHRCRFTAEVFDTNELVPWMRTFLSRITRMNLSNRTVEDRFKADLREMYRMYGIEGGCTDDLQ